jgi:hypothetical protein
VICLAQLHLSGTGNEAWRREKRRLDRFRELQQVTNSELWGGNVSDCGYVFMCRDSSKGYDVERVEAIIDCGRAFPVVP